MGIKSKKQKKPTRTQLDAAERNEVANQANRARREKGVGVGPMPDNCPDVQAAATSGVLKCVVRLDTVRLTIQVYHP